MRIRKNSKLYPQLGSEANPPLEPHICQLNQSPWDVLSFSSSSSSSQVEGHDNSLPAEDSNFGNPVGVLESSVASLMDTDNFVDMDDDRMGKRQMLSKGKDIGLLVYCSKTDGKRWQCKRLAKQGYTMCEHHLAQLKSYSMNNKNDNVVRIKKSVRGKKVHGRSAKKGSSSAGNPYEFYYYSGFGPKWGKKRSGAGDNTNVIVKALESESLSFSMKINDEEIDYVYDDDDDDDGIEDGENRKRKPVKARSLKSLL